MRRYLGLLPPVLILAGVLAFCLWTGARVGADSQRWRQPLEQSSEAALAGDWDAAGDLLAASYDDWRTRQLFLHIVVQHQVVEDAEAMYRRAASFLDGQETEEFRAELADLIHQLLALEEQANKQTDPFFKQAILLVVDANDGDKVRSILMNDIECMSGRHDDVASMYEKASAVAPAFGMVGTLVGLINMLKGMNLESGSSSIGSDMGTALITTLYGCILAHMIFNPIASNLRSRDEEEVLCKMIIVEGIMSIQSGENPKSLRDKLLTFVDQKQRGGESGGKGGKEKKEKKK